jgi:tetratricopeptide (TPR) repeat protein
MPHPYGVRDVEKLLRLPASTIRALVAAGFVTPERGPRNSLRFSFQDLIVLRTAQALADARVPQRRITRSMRELRQHLPESMPLSGLSIGAVADRVVVREGGARWQADSGQYLLEFGGDPASGALSVIERKRAPSPAEVAQDWFDRAAAIEREDPQTAAHGYIEAISADPTHLDALINLGRLLHEGGRLTRAMQVYRKAVELGEIDPVLYYNVGVLYQDMGKPRDAIKAYEAALLADENLADACYNLALLYEGQGRSKDAIRNMAKYRRLMRR